MTLVQLRYLVAVVDANLNITAAAALVNATQPGISKQLKLLEDELGFQIFVRRGKSLERVTPAGAQVIERARSVLLEANNIRSLAAAHQQEAEGDLRIISSQTQARYFLPSPLAQLKARYPAINIRQSLFGKVEALPTGEHDRADLGVVSTSADARPEERAIPLYRWRRKLVAPSDHPLTRLGRPPTLADLAAWPLIGYESLIRPESSVSQAFAQAGLKPLFAYTAQDSELIKQSVLQGLGVGLVAEMAVSPEPPIPDRRLAVIDVGDLFPVCATWAVVPVGVVPRPYALDLLSILAPRFLPHDIQRFLREGRPLPAGEIPEWSALEYVWTDWARSAARDADNVTPFPPPAQPPSPPWVRAGGC